MDYHNIKLIMDEKYIPPHQRSNIYISKCNITGSENQEQIDNKFNNTMPKFNIVESNKSSGVIKYLGNPGGHQDTNFNYKPIVSEEENKSNEETSINNLSRVIIPETIKPKIISNNIIFVDKDKIIHDFNTPVGSNQENKNYINFHMKNELTNKEFINWSNHYDKDLQDMYNTCVTKDLHFPYEEFIRLAYICTQPCYNNKKFRKQRPLI